MGCSLFLSEIIDPNAATVVFSSIYHDLFCPSWMLLSNIHV